MAQGKIGVAALCPETIRVVFRTQTCDGSQEVPDEYTVETKFADVFDAVGAGRTGGMLTIHDAAHAKYPANNTTTPSNADSLKDLAKAIAAEIWMWRRDRRDIVQVGIIAPDMSGLFDSVDWQMDDDHCRTRITAEPMGNEPEEYMHADVSECEWDGAGFRAFIPSATFSNGNITLPIARLYIKNGKLAAKANGNQSIKVCP